MQNRAFTLRDGQVHQEVDAVRVAIADRAIESGGDGPLKRRSAVWKFRTSKHGTHFFVTSSHLQKDMKGTVHPTEAHFGYNEPISNETSSWVGPIPQSRHLHVLAIRDLMAGEFQHVFAVHIPGFALMQKPQPFETGKIVTWSDPHPPNFEVTIGLTVVQGDWQDFVSAPNGQVAVGLLTGDSDRHAVISFDVSPYADTEEAIANMQRNLKLITSVGRDMPEEELSVVMWMNREVGDTIRMIELHGITATKSSVASG